jgi:hypothetical protein
MSGSTAGSPTPSGPKPMTALIQPSCASRLPQVMSPWTRTSGPSHSSTSRDSSRASMSGATRRNRRPPLWLPASARPGPTAPGSRRDAKRGGVLADAAPLFREHPCVGSLRNHIAAGQSTGSRSCIGTAHTSRTQLAHGSLNSCTQLQRYSTVRRCPSPRHPRLSCPLPNPSGAVYCVHSIGLSDGLRTPLSVASWNRINRASLGVVKSPGYRLARAVLSEGVTERLVIVDRDDQLQHREEGKPKQASRAARPA